MNALPARERPSSRIAIFFVAVYKPLVYVILGAAVISIAKEFKDFYIIMAVVIF